MRWRCRRNIDAVSIAGRLSPPPPGRGLSVLEAASPQAASPPSQASSSLPEEEEEVARRSFEALLALGR